MSHFKENSIFSRDFRKTLHYNILWKSVHWESIYSIPTDRQTDRQKDITKLIVAFGNPVKAPKKNKKNLQRKPQYICFNSYLQNDLLMIWYDMMYLLTVFGLTPGGSSTHKQFTERHKNFGSLSSLWVIAWHLSYNCGKAWKIPSQDSRRVPAGTMKIQKHTIRIHRHKYKHT